MLLFVNYITRIVAIIAMIGNGKWEGPKMQLTWQRVVYQQCVCCALPTQCLYTLAISKPITRVRSWQSKTITNNNHKSSTYTHRHHMYLWLFSNQFVCIVWFYSAYVYMCTYFDAQLCNLIRVLTFTSLQSSSSGSLSLYVTWVKGRDTKRAREHNECVCVLAHLSDKETHT